MSDANGQTQATPPRIRIGGEITICFRVAAYPEAGPITVTFAPPTAEQLFAYRRERTAVVVKLRAEDKSDEGNVPMEPGEFEVEFRAVQIAHAAKLVRAVEGVESPSGSTELADVVEAMQSWGPGVSVLQEIAARALDGDVGIERAGKSEAPRA